MWKCPVCEKENSMLLCESCGFDGSCDYEHYPTLGSVPWQSRSRAGYRNALDKQKNGIQSGISDAGREAIENIKKKQEEQAKKWQEEQAKKRQEELAKKQQEEQAKKQQEEQAKKLEKADKPFLWLGWASLVAIPYLLVFVVPPVWKLFYFLMALEPVTLLVQLHLRKHGLTRIFRNEKASKMFRTACTWISVILAFPMILIIVGFIREILAILVDGVRLSGSNLWNLFSMTIPTIYYLLLAQFYSTEG